MGSGALSQKILLYFTRWESSGVWLPNNMNIFNTTELYTLKWLRVGCAFFSTTRKKEILLCCAVLSHSVVPTLCDPMNYSPSGSSVHGTLQTRILEWVAISYSKEILLESRNSSATQLIKSHYLGEIKLLHSHSNNSKYSYSVCWKRIMCLYWECLSI